MGRGYTRFVWSVNVMICWTIVRAQAAWMGTAIQEHFIKLQCAGQVWELDLVYMGASVLSGVDLNLEIIMASLRAWIYTSQSPSPSGSREDIWQPAGQSLECLRGRQAWILLQVDIPGRC